MTDPEGRSFEVATMGSVFAEALCKGVLEVEADNLAGTSFRESPLGYVEKEHNWSFHFNDVHVGISYSAQKFTMDKDGNPVVMFNPLIYVARPRMSREYWPDLRQLSMGDGDVADDDRHPGLVLLVDPDDLPDSLDLDEEGICYVKEVWDYYIEDERYAPRKNLRTEYHVGDVFIGYTQLESSGVGELVDDGLSIEGDFDLEEHDASLYCSFSEFDVSVIEAICDGSFGRIKAILEQMGYLPDDDDSPESS